VTATDSTPANTPDAEIKRLRDYITHLEYSAERRAQALLRSQEEFVRLRGHYEYEAQSAERLQRKLDFAEDALYATVLLLAECRTALAETGRERWGALINRIDNLRGPQWTS